MLNLILFGPPGTGKGTQSIRIEKKYGIRHLSSGNIMRREIANNTPEGKIIKPYVDTGLLVPDKIVLKKVYCEVENSASKAGFVFDGFPRTVSQAKVMDRLLRRENIRLDMVISIEVEQEELLNRLKGRAEDSGRSDDKEEIMHKRLIIYEAQTKPLIAYYQKVGKLYTIDGMADTWEVFDRIRKSIDNYLLKKSIKLL